MGILPDTFLARESHRRSFFASRMFEVSDVFEVAVMRAERVGLGRGDDDEWLSEPAGRLGKALDLEGTWGWLGFVV